MTRDTVPTHANGRDEAFSVRTRREKRESCLGSQGAIHGAAVFRHGCRGLGEALAMGQGGNHNEHTSCTTPGRVVT